MEVVVRGVESDLATQLLGSFMRRTSPRLAGT